MKSFSSVRAVDIGTRLKKSFGGRLLMRCLTLTSLLVLMSILVSMSCSAMYNGPTVFADDAFPKAQSGELAYSDGTGPGPQQASDSWPMFRHDLKHTGYSTSTVPDGPSIDWTFKAVDGFLSSPVVEYGMVFIGSLDYNVYVLNEDTGGLVWNFAAENVVTATPAVVDGKVFIGSTKFYSLDAFTGSLIWTFDRPSREGDLAFYGSSPAVDEGAGLVFTGAQILNKDLDDKHQEFFCLNMSTGEMIWNVTDPSSSGQISSPAVSGNAVFISLGERVLSLDKRTGDILWEYPTPGSVSYSSPTVADGTVFIQTYEYGSLIALDEQDGSLEWSRDVLAGSSSSPAYHNGVVFVGSRSHIVYAFDAVNGDLLWRYTTDGIIFSSPAVADGKVVIASGDEYLYVLNESDGSLVWRTYPGGSGYVSSPTVFDGKIFVTDGKAMLPGRIGTLFAFGPPPRPIMLDIDPDTLNLNSKGRWITAYITAENASIGDIDPSSLLLNDIVPPAWWNVQNDTVLMVKFGRSAVEAILPISNAVDIKITGRWKDGGVLEVHDIIRVMNVGGHMESPLVTRSMEDVHGTSGSDLLSIVLQGSQPAMQDLLLRKGQRVTEVTASVREEWAFVPLIESEDVGNMPICLHRVLGKII